MPLHAPTFLTQHFSRARGVPTTPRTPRPRTFAAAVGALGLATVLALGTTACTPPPHSADSAACQPLHVPVRLHGQHPRWGVINGDYCAPRHSRRDHAALLMVAGGAENANYWNMPGLSAYSLAAAATSHGYATLAIDRLGTGRSVHPPSHEVTYTAQVDTVHQVAEALHHRGHPTVVGVGHSLGSGTLAGLAARHPHDLSAFVATGYGPSVSPETAKRNHSYQAPAGSLASKWSQLDDGYLSVRPDAVQQAGSLYRPATTRTALHAAQTHLGTLSKTELTTRPQGTAALRQGARLHGPVLALNGQEDAHYCLTGPLTAPKRDPHCADQNHFRQFERQLFPRAALTTRLIPRAGHALALQQPAPTANGITLRWLSSALGP